MDLVGDEWAATVGLDPYSEAVAERVRQALAPEPVVVHAEERPTEY
jgi:hypothetical protein